MPSQQTRVGKSKQKPWPPRKRTSRTDGKEKTTEVNEKTSAQLGTILSSKNTILNRWVIKKMRFKGVLKVASDSAFLSCCGNRFHNLGAETEKTTKVTDFLRIWSRYPTEKVRQIALSFEIDITRWSKLHVKKESQTKLNISGKKS